MIFFLNQTVCKKIKQQSTPCLKHEHIVKCRGCDEVLNGLCCQVVNELEEKIKKKQPTNQQRRLTITRTVWSVEEEEEMT